MIFNNNRQHLVKYQKYCLLKMVQVFNHTDLKLVEPSFGSKLTDLIIELDYLRKKRLGGTTHPFVFFQLKNVFHTLESIGSARIEGNRTTIAEYIETKLSESNQLNQNILEIENMTKALNFIDENISQIKINRLSLSELHKITVNNLLPPPDGEGDKSSGQFRKTEISIVGATHKPPPPYLVDSYMEELFNFINSDDSPKYDLLKTAIAHHRFVWIHPFANGNGRTVRLLTYAMLVKQGFKLDTGNRIINPTAIFCSDRNKYYDFLSKADSGNDFDILNWIEYMLTGLKEEIEKVDKLLDYSYLQDNILIPALKDSLDVKLITESEFRILKKTIEIQVLHAGDLKDILPNKIPAEVSRNIRQLKNKKMLATEHENSRKYVINFVNNYLLRGIIKQLDDNGFLPVHLNE